MPYWVFVEFRWLEVVRVARVRRRAHYQLQVSSSWHFNALLSVRGIWITWVRGRRLCASKSSWPTRGVWRRRVVPTRCFGKMLLDLMIFTWPVGDMVLQLIARRCIANTSYCNNLRYWNRVYGVEGVSKRSLLSWWYLHDQSLIWYRNSLQHGILTATISVIATRCMGQTLVPLECVAVCIAVCVVECIEVCVATRCMEQTLVPLHCVAVCVAVCVATRCIEKTCWNDDIWKKLEIDMHTDVGYCR